jgi:alanine racemase
MEHSDLKSQTAPRVVIDLDAIADNTRSLRKATSPDAKVMAVVKANGYGHGCSRVSETALSNGADALGVARIDEGVSLREAGISAPILVFGHIPEPDIPKLITHDLTATAYALPFARILSSDAVKYGKPIPIHVKVDTGMGRLGLLPDAGIGPEKTAKGIGTLVSRVLDISRLPGLHIEGIYTHFATADIPGCRFAAAQLESFLDLLASIRKSGLEIPIRHAANSGALIHMPESHLDMVRPGIALYGLYPSRETDRSRVALIPAMSLRTRIIHLKQVPAGFPVSYGGTYKTAAPTTIATVPIGYADGYRRAFSNRGQMLVRGRKAPVVGRVCMDLTLLDVGHIPGIALGDEAVVFGNQGGEAISADDLADQLDTINYEIVSSVSDRVAREYVTQASGVGRRASGTT